MNQRSISTRSAGGSGSARNHVGRSRRHGTHPVSSLHGRTVTDAAADAAFIPPLQVVMMSPIDRPLPGPRERSELVRRDGLMFLSGLVAAAVLLPATVIAASMMKIEGANGNGANVDPAHQLMVAESGSGRLPGHDLQGCPRRRRLQGH